jgi:hypothetical protein
MDKKITQEQIEAAAIKSAQNFGAPENIFHPDHGWLMVNKNITAIGKAFAKWFLRKK